MDNAAIQALPEVIVLMGPPGSGKTPIGHELSSRFGYRYTDYEAEQVERYGPLELFVNHRKKAVRELHEEILRSIDASLPPLVVETTALSERVFIESICDKFTAFIVLLETTASTALSRIEARPRGQNLSNASGTNRLIIDRFIQAHGDKSADLRVDTEVVSVEETAAIIHAAIAEGSSNQTGLSGT